MTTHLPWIDDRTRNLDGAHVEYFRGIRNPIAVKVGPSMTREVLRELLAILMPEDERACRQFHLPRWTLLAAGGCVLLLVLGSLGMFAVNWALRGQILNWGTEFKGGTQIEVQFIQEARDRHPEVVPDQDNGLYATAIALTQRLNQQRVLLFAPCMQPLLELIEYQKYLTSRGTAFATA